MRYGNWNSKNTDLYNECHTNPYRDIFIRLRNKRMEETHTHDTIEEHVQCKVCAQRACDATSKDMERVDNLIKHVWKTGHKHDGIHCEECEAPDAFERQGL